ncbi:DUF3100 domain-containing protein [Alkalihalobacillus sp. BA299]|uniref:DUF3100 domain-containing protein n=1 Tax=Alkalihalobacillus sp. BA299 TaxID=2815938 RepID=UPI001ADD0B6E|nr:DUF3100 domain-containing protein [Alkalihalobacillus sp. BA299]
MFENQGKLWKDWRLYSVILCVVLLADFIGRKEFSIGIGVILLLPMVFAFVLGLGLFFTPLIKEKQAKNAESLVFISISLLAAKLSLTMGPSLSLLVDIGPALILQEIGNLGTILFALPVAIFLGLKREAIGMTHSIGREGNVALITEKFGFNSPEARGVMAMYIFGTVLGAVFLGIISGFLASITPLNPLSLAMASGVGSGSMMSAASGSLIGLYPNLENDIIALAGMSNLISSMIGLYFAIFIALPLCEKLYKVIMKFKEKQVISKMDVEG